MRTENFQNLIQSLTGRAFLIETQDEEIQPEKEYCIYRKLPATGRTVSFFWKSAKNEDKILRSFITAYCSKYREPNPKAYDGKYFGSKSWDEKTEQEREHAYYHHASNMISKKELYAQMEENFNLPGTQRVFTKYGFYSTEYGLGIFVLFAGTREMEAVKSMKNFLASNSIPYANEFSDARWVLRFKLGLEKSMHTQILNQFTN